MNDGARLNMETDFRKPTDKERSLLERLLQPDFPGREELAPMLRNLLVKTVNENGGLDLRT
jgi:hypothetical protein